MKTIVTSKYQTTIPKKIREKVGISVHDLLEWELKEGEIVVKPVTSRFLKFQGSVKTGKGHISEDIKTARQKRARQIS